MWQRVAATTEPLSARPKQLKPAPPAPAAPVADEPALAENSIRRMARAPSFGTTLVPRGAPAAGPRAVWTPAGPEVGPVGRPEAGLDRRTSERLRRGVKDPDARIDLHGMTAERAHRACLVFLSDAMSRGSRMVLVITGKGRREHGGVMRDGRGVLRASLPGWLRASPLGGSIVGIYQAHQRHGGEGAFYVYLKRRR